MSVLSPTGSPRIRRNPRFRQPTGKTILISKRDRELLSYHQQIRYIRSTWLSALFPSSDITGLLKRWGNLFHEQPYLRRPDQQFAFNENGAINVPVISELDKLGAQCLLFSGVAPLPVDLQIGRPKQPVYFYHAVMICDVLLSIMIGAREKGIKVIAARELTDSFTIPLDGKRYISPDGLFALEYPDGECRALVLEADRGTENHTKFTAKMRNYREMYANELYKQWGMPKPPGVLIVTMSAQRAGEMKKGLMDITNGRGSPTFLFKVRKGNDMQGPDADGHMLTEPWSRAGYPLFNIGEVSGHNRQLAAGASPTSLAGRVA